MSESGEVEVTRRVVVGKERDPLVTWLLIGTVFVALLIGAVAGYAVLAGTFKRTVPRTAEEDALARTAAAIRANPVDGEAYATRAETLFRLGNAKDAYLVLDRAERAVGEQTPALLFVLRTRTMLLNAEERFAEAEEVGKRAMTASDDYLAEQGMQLAEKGVTGISGTMKTRLSIDTAIQLAGAYAGQKKWDNAVELYDYALRLDPLAGDILTMRGWVFLEMGEKEKAKADFEQTLEYLPDDPGASAGIKELEAN